MICYTLISIFPSSLFDEVVMTKPSASRNSSLEGFVLCSGFRSIPELQSIPIQLILSLGLEQALYMVNYRGEAKFGPAGQSIGPEFIPCIDLYDSEKSYSLNQPLSYRLELDE